MLGERPTAPGYTEIAIEPLPGNGTWAKRTIISPRGKVEVHWKKEDEGVSLAVKIPETIQNVSISKNVRKLNTQIV